MGKPSRKRRTQGLEEYQKQENTELRFQSYVKVLNEVKNGIINGTLSTLDKACNDLNEIHSFETEEVLLSFHNRPDSPFCGTNAVILACKHEQLEVLKHLLSSDRKLLKFYEKIGWELVHPSTEDAFKHSAFYYGIRSNNVKLVETLVELWPGCNFVKDPQLLEGLLSTNYAELRMKNVKISHEMEMYVEGKLLELRFFMGKQTVPVDGRPSAQDVMKRMDLVIDVIHNMVSQDLHELRDEFAFFHNLRFVAQNLHMLKRLMKPTYKSVPWEEMEFCLVTFALSKYKSELNSSNGTYRCFISTTALISHLQNFADCLKSQRLFLFELIQKNHSYPALPKARVRQDILSHFPCFESLYQDFEQSRDIRSLDMIQHYIALSREANPTEKMGRLVIIRTLQMIGELMKSTLTSPNISEATSSRLLSHLTKTTRNIIVQLRDSFSHGVSLFKRLEIEKDATYDVFSVLQSDLAKMGPAVNYILQQNLLQVTKELLGMLLQSNDPVKISEILESFGGLDLQLKNPMPSSDSSSDDFEGEMISRLNGAILEPTVAEKFLMNSLRETASKRSANRIALISAISLFALTVQSGSFRKVNHLQHSLKVIGSKAMGFLHIEEALYEDQHSLARCLIRSFMTRQSVDKFSKVNSLMSNLSFLGISDLVSDSSDAEAIEELHSDLNRSNSNSDPQSQVYVDLNSILLQKLDELETAMEAKPETPMNESDGTSRKEEKLDDKKSTTSGMFPSLQKLLSMKISGTNQDQCPTNQTAYLKWLLHLEMLLMDIMAVLGSRKCCLVNNLGSLDANTPTIDGKMLRDHLAHGNSILDLLLHNPSTSMMANAAFLASKRDDLVSNIQIGKVEWMSTVLVKKQYDAAISLACTQQQLFKSLQEGDMESVKFCVENGADIHGRTSNLMTSLHYAAMSPQADPLKYILAQWSGSINVLNSKGQNPLHLAASCGSVKNVTILLKDDQIHIDSQDFFGRTPLHFAAEAGQVGVIRFLLSNSADPEALDHYSQLPLMEAILNNQFGASKILLKLCNLQDTVSCRFTLLHIAAEGGATDIVNFLLRKGANVNAISDAGSTPLHLASYNGQLEIVKALVAHGADVNGLDKIGGTPLHMACEIDHKELVRYLLDHNANVNARYNDGTSPIFHSIIDGKVETVKLLLNKNANIRFIWAPFRRTLLHAALTERQNEEVVKLLVTMSTHWINCQDANGQVPLHYSARQGDSESINILIGHGADLNIPDNQGRTPVFDAVLARKTNALECLVTHGANVNIADNTGCTLLQLSSSAGLEEIVAILIKAGAIVGAATGRLTRSTPLHDAIVSGSKNIVKLLLANGASINETQFVQPPLHHAAFLGNREILDVLCEAGASINEVDAAGFTPFQYACLGGHYSTAAALFQSKCKVDLKVEGFKNHPITLAINSNEPKLIKFLLKKGVQVDPAHLKLAVLSGSIELVVLLLNYFPQHALSSQLVFITTAESRKGMLKVLLKKGLDVNVACEDSLDTPLHVVGTEDDAIARLLIDHGANPNKRNSRGWTPLHKSASSGNLKVTTMLLDAGADTSLKTSDDKSALQLASIKGHLDTVKLLIERGADLHHADLAGRKAVHFAAYGGFCDIVDFFISNQNVDIYDTDANCDTLLHITVKGTGDCMAVATYLVNDKKMEVNRTNSQGLTPLHMAAALSKNVDMVKFLLRNGAYYNIKCLDGRKPVDISTRETRSLLSATHCLMKAVKGGDLSQVKRALNEGAVVDAKNHQNDSPLLWAACQGNDGIVELLLKTQANSNITGKDGNSPLHYACKGSKLNVVLILLGGGANYEPRNNMQKTPLDYATDKGVSSFLKLIGGFFSKFQLKKVLRGKLRIDLTPGEARALFNCCNDQGKTLLACAMSAGSLFAEALQAMFVADHNKLSAVRDLLQREKFAEAHNIAQAELKLRQETYSRESLMWVDLYDLVTKALYKLQRWSETIVKSEDLYNIYRDMLGDHHRKTLEALGFVGLVMHRVGRNEEALQTFEAILEKGETVFRAQDEEWLAFKNHMGLVLCALRRPDEAIALFEEALTFYKKRHGCSHPLTLTAQKNIAMALCMKGNYEESLKLYKIVLNRRETVLGPNHSDTMRVRSEIANVLRGQGKHKEAIAMYDDSLYRQSGALPVGHGDIMMSKLNKVMALLTNGEHQRAYQLYKELAKYKHVMSPDILKLINAVGKSFATIHHLTGSDSFNRGGLDEGGEDFRAMVHREMLDGNQTGCMSLLQYFGVEPDASSSQF